MTINFTASYLSSKTNFIASTDGSALSVDFTSSVSLPDTDGTELPPVNPGSPGSPNPPLPLGYQPDGYVYPNFDPDLLPRLENRVSNNIPTSVERTIFKVANVDLGDHFISCDHQKPIAGASSGQVVLAATVTGSSIRLTYDYFKPYTRFTWQQVINGLTRTVASGWIVGSPQVDTDSKGVTTVTLQLGDELELFAKRHTEPERLYCGNPPKTAGEAARIYSQYNGLFTTSYPTGHELLEPPQKFVNESPWDFLQLLYSPTDHDVRTSKDGYIEVLPRPNLSESTPLELNHRSVLEVPTEYTRQYRPYTRVTVRNQYTTNRGLRAKSNIQKSVNGLPENTSPWFQNGYTETITTTYEVGGTITYSKEEFYGYVPTEFPISKSSTESSGCDISPIETEWRLITTKTFSIGYSQHISGSLLVHKKENWLTGLKLQENPTNPTEYILFDGTQEYSVETFTNVPQINPKVCRKDYIFYKLEINSQSFKLNDEFELTLVSNSNTRYRAKGVANTNGDFYLGVGQQWTVETDSGEYDSELKSWVKQPTNYAGRVTPPNSEWIRPNVNEISAHYTHQPPFLTNNFERTTAPPQQAPCCFTRSQLITFADRYLREQFGLSNAITVVIPDRLGITIGTNVYFTHSDGTRLPYLVFAEETNQTGVISTRTLSLIRTY